MDSDHEERVRMLLHIEDKKKYFAPNWSFECFWYTPLSCDSKKTREKPSAGKGKVTRDEGLDNVTSNH